jgi:hypothetical protein
MIGRHNRPDPFARKVNKPDRFVLADCSAGSASKAEAPINDI